MTPGQRIAHGTRQPPVIGVLLTTEGSCRHRASSSPRLRCRLNTSQWCCQRFQVVEFVEQLSYVSSRVYHTVWIHTQSRSPLRLLLRCGTRAWVGVHQTKKGLSSAAFSMNRKLAREKLLIDRLHALDRQRPGVLDLLSASGLAQLWSTPRGPNFFLNSDPLIVGILRFLLGVQVVEVRRRTHRNHERWVRTHRGHRGGSCRTDR
jgi:hypothetical protein